MKGAMGNMMKQAQKMQEDMQKAQQEIANMEVEGQAGGGMVKVVMNGRHELRRVNIDDSRIAAFRWPRVSSAYSHKDLVRASLLVVTCCTCSMA